MKNIRAEHPALKSHVDFQMINNYCFILPSFGSKYKHCSSKNGPRDRLGAVQLALLGFRAFNHILQNLHAGIVTILGVSRVISGSDDKPQPARLLIEP